MNTMSPYLDTAGILFFVSNYDTDEKKVKVNLKHFEGAQAWECRLQIVYMIKSFLGRRLLGKVKIYLFIFFIKSPGECSAYA